MIVLRATGIARFGELSRCHVSGDVHTSIVKKLDSDY